MQYINTPSRIQLDKILLLTEFPPWADVAVPHALALAREHRARMHVAHPVSTHTMQKLTQVPTGGSFRQSWRDLVFETAARQMVVDREKWVERLRHITGQHDFDLIFMSLGRAEETSERALGRTLEHVFSSAGCPVMVIGPAVRQEFPARTEPATILHATDFSPHALAASQHAFSWAQEYQSWLTMLHVVDGIGGFDEHERERLEEPFRRWMQELVPEELPVWCEIEHRVEFGSPAERIVHAAKQLYADLVVIGLTGMDGVAQHSPGATALQVISRSPCPVLVVSDQLKKMTAQPVVNDRRLRARAVAA